MKIFYLALFFAGVMILFVSTGCKKQPLVARSGTTYFYPTSPPPNRPPISNAGPDFLAALISNEITLKGKATDPDKGDTISYTWTKITGPACTIVSPQSLTTTVSNLIQGEYQFELLVSDNHGAINRDTVLVKCSSITSFTNQANFLNLRWTCPMGCTVSISDIYSNLPSNTPFRVFLKFVNQAGWFEAIPISRYSNDDSLDYYYEITSNNDFVLFTESDVSINVDVRIVF